jgi:hypothetical protein
VTTARTFLGTSDLFIVLNMLPPSSEADCRIQSRVEGLVAGGRKLIFHLFPDCQLFMKI